MSRTFAAPSALALALFLVTSVAAAPGPPAGRWNATLTFENRSFPMSFEFERHGDGLVAFLQPVAGPPVRVTATWSGQRVSIDARDQGVVLDGEFDHGAFNGTMSVQPGTTPAQWHAVAAPRLPASRSPRWRPMSQRLIQDGLRGWRVRPVLGEPRMPEGWHRDGNALVSEGLTDLISLEAFRDFKLHLEYRLEPGADAGVHLRGRYEIQLKDGADEPSPALGGPGSVYGWIAPSRPCPSSGDWHSLDATLLGRTLWLSVDGVTLHDGVTIPSITGDALDSDEDLPGPLVLQGHLGLISFRNIEVTRAD